MTDLSTEKLTALDEAQMRFQDVHEGDAVWLRDVDHTGSMHVCSKGDDRAVLYVPADLGLLAEVLRLREAIQTASDIVTMELNPSNYGHDDACLLNDQMIEAFGVLDTAIALSEPPND